MAKFWNKKQFWGALIGIVLLAVCVKDIRLSELELLAGRVDVYYLAAALVAGFLFVICRALRWRLMISQKKNIPITRAVTLYSVGQVLGTIMPALTGQVGRVVLFSRKEGLGKTFVFSTLVLEILFDAISLIVFMFFASAAFVFPAQYRFVSAAVAAFAIGVLVILYLILHFQDRLEDFARRRFRHRWPGVYITCKKFIRSFTKGIEMLKSSQHMFGTLGLSLLAWTTHMLVIWFLIEAFGFQVPFATAAVVMIINTIALMIPITPGNAGTFEVAVSYSLAAFPEVGRSDAVLFALALHLVDLLPVFTFGYLFLHLEKLSLKEIKAVHEEDIILDRIDEEGAFIEETQV